MNEQTDPLNALLSPENGFSLKETLDQFLNSERINEEFEEEQDAEISDKPNVSGTSLLNPDSSLGRLPLGLRSFKPSSSSSCATAEEDPGTKAWSYLLRLNIVELLEVHQLCSAAFNA